MSVRSAITRIKLICIGILSLLILVCTSTTSAQFVAFHNANVIVGTGDHVLHNAVLVVDSNMIVCVGNMESCRDFTSSADTEWVDLSGHWIIPGLIDVHFHLLYDEEPDFTALLRTGVTTVQESGPMNASDDGDYEIGHGQVERLAELVARIESGDIIGPRMQYCGPQMFSSDVPYNGVSRMLRLRSDEDAFSIINYLAERGASCVKLISGVTPEHMEKVLTAANEMGLRGIGHTSASFSFDKQLSFPWSQIHHLWIPSGEFLNADLRDSLPENSELANFHVGLTLFDPDSPESKRFVEKVAASNIAWVPTLAATADFPWGMADIWWDMIYQGATERDSMLIQGVFSGSGKLSEEPMDTPDLLYKSFVNFSTSLTQMLYEAGVPIITGSDSDYTSLPYGLQDELEHLVAAGLSPLDAIRAATALAAKSLGMENKIGSLEAGKLADFVVLENNPLEDIRNIRSIRKVILDGRVLTFESEIPGEVTGKEKD